MRRRPSITKGLSVCNGKKIPILVRRNRRLLYIARLALRAASTRRAKGRDLPIYRRTVSSCNHFIRRNSRSSSKHSSLLSARNTRSVDLRDVSYSYFPCGPFTKSSTSSSLLVLEIHVEDSRRCSKSSSSWEVHPGPRSFRSRAYQRNRQKACLFAHRKENIATNPWLALINDGRFDNFPWGF